MNLRALTYAFALCSLSMSAAEAQSIRCTHKHTGKRTTAYCDTLTPQIIALAKHAYAACGAYVTKGADISSLAQKGFVRGKTRYPQFYAKAPNEFTKKTNFRSCLRTKRSVRCRGKHGNFFRRTRAFGCHVCSDETVWISKETPQSQ